MPRPVEPPPETPAGARAAVQSLRARAILLVMLGTLSSRLLGFVRNAAIAFYFGAGAKADVLNFVQTIPLLLRRLAAEGSLETALVPELARSRQRDPSLAQSRAIWRKLLAIQWGILLPLCLLLLFFPQQIIAVLSDFPLLQQQQLAAKMLYLISPYLFLLAQSVLLGALLSSQQRFTLSAFAPLLSSVAVLACIVGLEARYDIFAVALGLLLGMVLQLALLLPPLWRAGYRLWPDFRLREAAILRIVQVWLPLWLSTGILAIMQFVANYLASRQISGSISALTNALVFFQLPQGLIYASIAKVCLPQLSASRTGGKNAEKPDEAVQQVLRYGLSQLAILFLPASLVLLLLSQPLIAVTLQRGAFGLQNTLLTAEVLRYYLLGSLPVALFRFLQQYFYARSEKLLPLLQTLLVAAIDIPLSLLLIYALDLGVIALPIANSISYAVVTIYAFCMAARRNASLRQWRHWHRALALLPRLLLLLAALTAVDGGLKQAEQALLSPNSDYDNYAQWWSSGGSWQNFAVLAVHAGLLLLCFYLLCRLLRIPILRSAGGRK